MQPLRDFGTLLDDDQEEEDQRVALPLAQWTELAHKRGLLTVPGPTESAAVPQAACGVSLLWLLGLCGMLHSLVHEPDATTATVVSKLVIPFARKRRLYDFIPRRYTAPPTAYAVHAWGASFRNTVQQLVQRLCTQGDRDQQIATVFVWIDIVALPQQAEIPGTFADVTVMREMASMFQGDMVMVIDPQHLVLTRTWCCWEVWLWIYHNQVSQLRVCLPETHGVDDILRLEAQVKQLDITSTKATVPEDRTHILSEIRKSVGMKIMQRNLNEALLLAIRSRLRWSERYEDFLLYCTLLLKSGEHARLQEVLHTIPDLHDESVVSHEDFLNLFTALADPVTQRLSHESFLKMLRDMGLGMDRQAASSVFFHLSGRGQDYNGSVGHDEFFAWFRSQEKKDYVARERSMKTPVALTAKALVENMRRMAVFLSHKGLQQLAGVFRHHLSEHKQGRLLPPGSALATSELRGNWLVVSNDVVWRLHAHDYRGATTVLYSLLMWNGDMIGRNPDTMPKQDFKSMPLQELSKVLLQYIELFVALLKTHPRTNEHHMHHKFYATCTEQLLEPEALDNLLKAHRKGQISHAQVIITKAMKELERSAIVRNMIQLKYGNTKQMDGTLIVEAELSVAEMLCQTKLGPKPAGFTNYMCTDRDVEEKVSSVMASSKMMQHMKRNHYDNSEKSVLLRLGTEAEAFYKELEQEQQQERSGSRRMSGSGDDTESQSQLSFSAIMDGASVATDAPGLAASADPVVNLQAMMRRLQQGGGGSRMDSSASSFSDAGAAGARRGSQMLTASRLAGSGVNASNAHEGSPQRRMSHLGQSALAAGDAPSLSTTSPTHSLLTTLPSNAGAARSKRGPSDAGQSASRRVSTLQRQALQSGLPTNSGPGPGPSSGVGEVGARLRERRAPSDSGGQGQGQGGSRRSSLASGFLPQIRSGPAGSVSSSGTYEKLISQSSNNPMTRLRVSTGSTSSPSIGASSSLGHLQQARSLSPSSASPPARTTSALAAITSATAAHAQGQAAAHSQQAPPPGEVTQPRSLSGSGASQRADSGAGAGGGRPASPVSSGRPKGTLPKLGGAVLPDITSPGKRQHRLSQAGS